MRGAVIGIALMAIQAIAPGLAAQTGGLRLGSGGEAPSRADIFRDQTRLMDSRLSQQYSASPAERSPGMAPYSGNRRSEFLPTARAAARRHGIPVDLFLRLVQQESRWNPSAVSNAGARGLAQLMPDTAVLLGVNADDPEQNLNGGARYLRMMYDRFGDWRLALAAYNAGPGAVEAYDGIPPFDETTQYVRSVMGSG